MAEEQTASRKINKWVWLLIVPLLLLLTVSINLVMSKNAHAAAGARYAGQEEVQPGFVWNAWFGNYQLFADGSIVYCAAETGLDGPPDTTATYYGSVEFVNSWQGGVFNPFPDQGMGPVVTGAKLNQAAYILSKYGATNDNRLASVIYAAMIQNFEAVPAVRQLAVAARQAEIDALWAEAVANAGPYTVDPIITGANPRSIPRSGDVTNVGAKSATGNWQSGYPFTLTMTGDAVFLPSAGITLSNGDQTATGTTSGSPISVPWEATDTGHFSVNLKVENLPHYLIAIRRAANPNDQDVFATQQTYMDATTTYAYQSFQPSSSSQAVHQVFVGEEVYDIVWPQTDGTYGWARDEFGEYVPVVYTVTAYGPYAERQPLQPHVPAGAPVAGVEKFTATGPDEEHKVSFGNDLTPGWYHFVVSVEKADQDPMYVDYIDDSYFAPFAEDNETTYVSVRAPMAGFMNLLKNPTVILTLGVALAIALSILTKKRISKKTTGRARP
ncbi:hypothetical protein FWG95_01185 [Candidatus Saccharibacteria bacterium]|nr:hypothetical protein [Candidatus Saccharibacteria bacterium]